MARTWDRTTARAAIVRIHTLSFINLDDVQHGIEINHDHVSQESSWVFCLFNMCPYRHCQYRAGVGYPWPLRGLRYQIFFPHDFL